MLSHCFFALTAAALLVSGEYSLPPAQQAAQDSGTVLPISNDFPQTDGNTIGQMAKIVDQKQGAPADDTPPDLAQEPTKLTVLDGNLVDSEVPNANSNWIPRRRRDDSAYELVFGGTMGDGSRVDAAIEGTAYLSYTLVPNASYTHGLSDCLGFCDQTDGCVFINLYYEIGNYFMDSVFPEKSNLKCVAYGDIHTANEKSNFGSEQLLAPQPAETTTIMNSSGYAAISAADPPVPEGYELVFGPISAANNAPGYMGFGFLTKYDPAACAQLCNQRPADSAGGACKYFNIWRATVHGVPTTYTCSMYYIPTDALTAVNTGQGSLQVTLSRGYARISHVPDGTFESYTCDNGDVFCFTDKTANWTGTSPANGHFDATVFHYAPYAHLSTSVGLLGSAFGSDPYAGTLRPAAPLAGLERGRNYTVQFFHSSTFSGVQLEAEAFVVVWWNGIPVGNVSVGYSQWTYYEYRVLAKGEGADVLLFTGGKAPAYDFIDDIYLFLS